jgi:uncharacterized protein (DUF1501 family)
MALTRRTFIQGSAAAGVSVAFFSTNARADAAPGRSLVVVQMAGGNDTLNTFIPYTDTRYRAARPTLSIPESASIPIDDRFAFHPSLARLVPFYKNRKFAFITDLGFPSFDRSHFYCADVWNNGFEGVSSSPTGWLGRFADLYLASTSPLTSIAIGTRIPNGIVSRTVTPSTIVDLESFDIDVMQTDAAERSRFIASARSIYDIPRTGDDVEFIRNAGGTMLRTIDLLKTVPPAASVDYPKDTNGNETELAKALRIVAQTIAANIGTTIAWVTIGGFDFHSLQVALPTSGGSAAGFHARLLADVAGSLAAFQTELELRHIDDRVLTFAWSEFSRRVVENASLGTDHGKASTAMVLGSAVKGGTCYGGVPDLGNLDDGDLRTKTDFRAVYATIIRDWFGQDPLPVLNHNYENLGFIERAVGRRRGARH